MIVSGLLATTAVLVKMDQIASPVFVHMDTQENFVIQVSRNSLFLEIMERGRWNLFLLFHGRKASTSKRATTAYNRPKRTLDTQEIH